MDGLFGTNDSYAESSVKRVKSFKIAFFQALIIAAVVALFLASFLFWNGVVLFFAIVALVAAIYFIPFFNVEYECVYVNGQFDFDMIMNGAHRKKLLRIDFDSADLLTVSSSHELDAYRNNSKYASKDFSSHDANAKTYTIAGKDSKGNLVMVTFEPSEKMLGLIKGNPTLRRKFKEY